MLAMTFALVLSALTLDAVVAELALLLDETELLL